MKGNVLEWASRVQRQAAVVLLGACALATIGCGGSESEKPSAATGSAQTASVAQGGEAIAAALPATASEPMEEEGEVAPTADSLPPEVVASLSDTLVTPGVAVEIIALGSPDVRDVTLSDGIGRAQPFVYDLGTKSWRTFYRVPMLVRGERLGLSVTAKNDGNRWRRVWVFLRVQREDVPTVVQPEQP